MARSAAWRVLPVPVTLISRGAMVVVQWEGIDEEGDARISNGETEGQEYRRFIWAVMQATGTNAEMVA